MNKYPKYINVLLQGERWMCFVIQENGKYYTGFSLPYPAHLISIDAEILREILTFDTEIVHIYIHN